MHYVAPSDRGITSTREDGLCVYCQLVLLPDTPQYLAHQPSFQLLYKSNETCELCRMITSSLGQGSPDLKEMYNSEYPPIYDPGIPTFRITVKCKKKRSIQES